MWSLIFVILLVHRRPCEFGQEAVGLAVSAKGWLWGNQVKQGMSVEQVTAILSEPQEVVPLPCNSSVQVGSKGYWLYPALRIKVYWFTPTEIWWTVPNKDAPYTPKSLRVSKIEFFVPR